MRRVIRSFGRFLRRYWPITVLVMVLIVAGTGFGYARYHHANDSADIVRRVGKLMILPSGETPVVTTVENKDQLQQPFLQKAENGDKVLLYSKARTAVVYRPNQDRIVNIGPILTTLVPVFIRAGAPAAPVNDVVSQIESHSVNYSIVSRDISTKSDYSGTLVIDLTGARTSATEQLATLLKGKIATLPPGESRPDADILVIVGNQ